MNYHQWNATEGQRNRTIFEANYYGWWKILNAAIRSVSDRGQRRITFHKQIRGLDPRQTKLCWVVMLVVEGNCALCTDVAKQLIQATTSMKQSRKNDRNLPTKKKKLSWQCQATPLLKKGTWPSFSTVNHRSSKPMELSSYPKNGKRSQITMVKMCSIKINFTIKKSVI